MSRSGSSTGSSCSTRGGTAGGGTCSGSGSGRGVDDYRSSGWRLGDVSRNTITHVADKTCGDCLELVEAIHVEEVRRSLRVRRRYLT